MTERASTSFSIIITCFNQSAFIRETVESALSQTYAARQVIVVDDASTDDSLSLLRPYGDRITLITSARNGGASVARNLGAAHADADYLAYLDGDDVLIPWALELYAHLIALKCPVLILGNLLYFNGRTVAESSIHFKDGSPAAAYDARPNEIRLVEYDYFMNKDRQYRACVSAFVIERQAFEKIQGWTNEIFPMEDTELLLKLGYSGRTLQIDSPPTVCYRAVQGSIMRQMPRWIPMTRRVIEKAKAGAYSVKGRSRVEAFGFLGGAVLFQFQRALKARLYRGAGELLYHGFPLILAASLRRLQFAIRGKRPLEVLPGLSARACEPEVSAEP